jgi:hypothetical protein
MSVYRQIWIPTTEESLQWDADIEDVYQYHGLIYAVENLDTIKQSADQQENRLHSLLKRWWRSDFDGSGYGLVDTTKKIGDPGLYPLP